MLNNLNLSFSMHGLEIAFGLDLEQRRSILLLSFFHPMTVDVERSGVDHTSVWLEPVRVFEQIDEFDWLWFVLEGLEARDCHHDFNVDAESFAREKHTLGFRLFYNNMD